MKTSTTPAERGITLSGKLPLAVRDGTKTMTRRIMKPQPTGDFLSNGIGSKTGKFFAAFSDGAHPCPYGKPGARLYVREDHYQFGHWEPVPSQRTKLGRQRWAFVADSEEVRFEAPEGLRKGRHHKDSATPAWHKRLGRFMPKRFARTILEITNIRAERLQDISEPDAYKEGIRLDEWEGNDGEAPSSSREAFEWLWNSIHGPGSWDANPWVWVVTFKRIDGKEAAGS